MNFILNKELNFIFQDSDGCKNLMFDLNHIGFELTELDCKWLLK